MISVPSRFFICHFNLFYVFCGMFFFLLNISPFTCFKFSFVFDYTSREKVFLQAMLFISHIKSETLRIHFESRDRWCPRQIIQFYAFHTKKKKFFFFQSGIGIYRVDKLCGLIITKRTNWRTERVGLVLYVYYTGVVWIRGGFDRRINNTQFETCQYRYLITREISSTPL